MRVWSQLPSLILLQLVDSGGGTGDPNGADGPQQEESAPTNLAISKTRMLVVHAAFARRRGLPGAGERRRRRRARRILTTKTSGVALPKVAPCVKADYSLVAYHNGVGWHSDPIGPVSVTAAPSETQACTDAPQVTFGVQKLKKKLKPLRKKKWRVPVRFLADGMGTAHVVLSRKKQAARRRRQAARRRRAAT